jgi:hypothetical protein
MKCKVIYLEEVEDSKKSMLNVVETGKRFGYNIEPFAGFTPFRADPKISELGLKPYLPGPKIFDIKASKGGVRGCFMSHFMLWVKCVAEREEYMILEDDVTFHRGLPETFEYKDVLHLDAWRDGGYSDDLDLPIVCKYNHKRKGDRSLKGAYAYLIKPEAAQKLITGARTLGFTAADLHISDRHGIELEQIYPRIVTVNINKRSLTSDRSFRL